MKAEHDPLASHIFLARRHYRNVSDTKSGKRDEMTALSSFNTACDLGFRGSLDEWKRLMGAVARRLTWLSVLRRKNLRLTSFGKKRHYRAALSC
jgi:hypothetical protein